MPGGYYHDDDFLRSFSYKVYQAFIGLLFAGLFGQSFQPTLQSLTVAPELLKSLFLMTLPASGRVPTFLTGPSFHECDARHPERECHARVCDDTHPSH